MRGLLVVGDKSRLHSLTGGKDALYTSMLGDAKGLGRRPVELPKIPFAVTFAST
jgi:hypothetical protein